MLYKSLLTAALLVLSLASFGEAIVIPLLVPAVQASSVEEGLDRIRGRLPQGRKDIREAIGDAIRFIVTFVALAAVVTIVAAGIILIVGFGSEQSKERAKKIIIYTIIGLVVIFLVRVIVGFFTQELPSTF